MKSILGKNVTSYLSTKDYLERVNSPTVPDLCVKLALNGADLSRPSEEWPRYTLSVTDSCIEEHFEFVRLSFSTIDKLSAIDTLADLRVPTLLLSEACQLFDALIGILSEYQLACPILVGESAAIGIAVIAAINSRPTHTTNKLSLVLAASEFLAHRACRVLGSVCPEVYSRVSDRVWKTIRSRWSCVVDFLEEVF